MEHLILDEIIKKMAHQIEMSTADAPAQNVFHQTINLFGRPIPSKTTFSFGNAAKQNGNPPAPTPATATSQKETVNADNNFCLPVQVNTTWTPFNVDMANSTDRSHTFITWPKQMSQKRHEMVTPGFYYTGRGDVVQCFHCGLALKHWDSTDCVDAEHRKYAADCKFLLMVRGIH